MLRSSSRFGLAKYSKGNAHLCGKSSIRTTRRFHTIKLTCLKQACVTSAFVECDCTIGDFKCELCHHASTKRRVLINRTGACLCSEFPLITKSCSRNSCTSAQAQNDIETLIGECADVTRPPPDPTPDPPPTPPNTPTPTKPQPPDLPPFPLPGNSTNSSTGGMISNCSTTIIQGTPACSSPISFDNGSVGCTRISWFTALYLALAFSIFDTTVLHY
jgi:hypothetical protein